MFKLKLINHDFLVIVNIIKNLHITEVDVIPSISSVLLKQDKNLLITFDNKKIEPITIEKQHLVGTSIYKELTK